jgi:hypothetical protein
MDTLRSKMPTTRALGASSGRSTDDLRRSRESLILRCQRIIFSAYRSDQYSDPEGYMASLGAVLEQYQNEVIVYVTDPRTGVQRGCKWPPTIAEIVSACDTHAAHLSSRERFSKWGSGNEIVDNSHEENKPTYEELKEKYGENFGLSPHEERRKPAPAPSWDEIIAMYQGDLSLTARLRRRDDLS